MEQNCECDLKGRNVMFFQCSKAGFQLYKIILAVSIARKTRDLPLSTFATPVGSRRRQVPLKTRLPLTTFPASNPDYVKCCKQPWVIPKNGRGPQSILKMIGENSWPSRPTLLISRQQLGDTPWRIIQWSLGQALFLAPPANGLHAARRLQLGKRKTRKSDPVPDSDREQDRLGFAESDSALRRKSDR